MCKEGNTVHTGIVLDANSFFLVLVTFTLLPSELTKGGEGRLEAWELHFP